MGGLVLDGGGATCSINKSCTLFVQSTNTTYTGTCQSGWGGGSGGLMPCSCETNYGPYVPSSGTSHCVNEGILES